MLDTQNVTATFIGGDVQPIKKHVNIYYYEGRHVLIGQIMF